MPSKSDSKFPIGCFAVVAILVLAIGTSILNSRRTAERNRLYQLEQDNRERAERDERRATAFEQLQSHANDAAYPSDALSREVSRFQKAYPNHEGAAAIAARLKSEEDVASRWEILRLQFEKPDVDFQQLESDLQAILGDLREPAQRSLAEKFLRELPERQRNDELMRKTVLAFAEPDSNRDDLARELQPLWRYSASQRDAEAARKLYQQMAEEDWKSLQPQLNDANADPKQRWRLCAEFQSRYADTELAGRAQTMMRQLLAEVPSAWSNLILPADESAWAGALPEGTVGLIDLRRSPQMYKPVIQASVSPDGEHIALVRKWRFQSPEPRRQEFRTAEVTVWNMTGLQPVEVARWRMEDAVQFSLPGSLATASFDSSGSQLVVATRTAIEWFDVKLLEAGKGNHAPSERKPLPQGMPTPSSLSQSPAQTVYAKGDAIEVWDVQHEQVRRVVVPRGASVHSFQLALGRSLLAVQSKDFISAPGLQSYQVHVLAVWDVSTSFPKRLTTPEVGHLIPPATLPLVFSPDARIIACASEIRGNIRLWDWAGKGRLGEAPELSVAGLQTLAFSPDGQTLVTATSGKVALWNVQTLKSFEEWELPSSVHAVDFSADGRFVLACLDQGAVAILERKIAAEP